MFPWKHTSLSYLPRSFYTYLCHFERKPPMIGILIVKDNYHLRNTGINSCRRLYFNIDVFYFILMKMEKIMMIEDLCFARIFLFNILQQINAIITIFLYGEIKRILPVPFCFIQQVNNSWLYLNEDNICDISEIVFQSFYFKMKNEKKMKMPLFLSAAF